jgi:hypothetical protein
LTVAERSDEQRASRLGTTVLIVVIILFVSIGAIVVIRAAPLADDFVNCLEPRRFGLGPTLAASFERLGVLRRAHLLEILLTSQVCERSAFGVAIAVPLVLTLGVGLALRGLLRDLGVPGAWPSLGAALWLLQPLGSEAALWPAALHVPLGLLFALGALRLHRGGRHVLGALATVGAVLSVEQVVLALPLAVWVLGTPTHRRRALAITIGVVVCLFLAHLIWPGDDPRLGVSIAERVSAAFTDPAFFAKFAAVGLGVQSIPLAVIWAFPVSVVVITLGTLLGSRLGPSMLSEPWMPGVARQRAKDSLLGCAGMIALVNIPVVFTVPHQGSPRLFAPTWLIICGLVVTLGALLLRRAARVWGAFAGGFAACALLSLALSVWVRVEHAGFTESATIQIAAAIPDDAVVAVCGVRRAVVEPAPRGAFAVHEFVYDWAARDALEYYTGKRASFELSGEPWGDRSCHESRDVDRVFSFPDLVDRWRRGG